MARSRHPKKVIEAAIAYAESKGWQCDDTGSHCWGKLYCPGGQACCRVLFVNSTPSSPEKHARQIRRTVDQCSFNAE